MPAALCRHRWESENIVHCIDPAGLGVLKTQAALASQTGIPSRVLNQLRGLRKMM